MPCILTFSGPEKLVDKVKMRMDEIVRKKQAIAALQFPPRGKRQYPPREKTRQYTPREKTQQYPLREKTRQYPPTEKPRQHQSRRRRTVCAPWEKRLKKLQLTRKKRFGFPSKTLFFT